MSAYMEGNNLSLESGLVNISKIIYEETPFLPRLSVFYNYHHILKTHQFIRDYRIVDRKQGFVLQVVR